VGKKKAEQTKVRSRVTTSVTLETIRAAFAELKGIAHRTPLLTSKTIDGLAGRPVWMKAENLQKTGSFKVRGAFTAINHLGAPGRARGVVTASAGNHAQGVALAGRLTAVDVTVFMPATASIAKVLATKAYGAAVKLEGATFDDAAQAAVAYAESNGAIIIPAFDHDDIIAGQGTVALEILEEQPGIETVVVPVGGGGLLSGMAVALKESKPSIHIVGVQAEGARAAVDSWNDGNVTPTRTVKTIADGIAVKRPAERTLHYLRKHVDEMVTVSDEAIAAAIVTLLERTKMVVEGAGAAALAALFSGAVTAKGRTAVVLSGGNIDVSLMGSLIERGMLKAGRFVRIFSAVEDRPGGLARLLGLVAEAQGNVIEVIHNRTSAMVPLGMTGVELQIETRDAAHVDEIVELLKHAGYPVQIMP
jgi:threonine dehydratase